MKQIITVSGMKCPACSGRLERALKAAPGVTAATVELEQGRALVDSDLSAEALTELVADLGFTAEKVEQA